MPATQLSYRIASRASRIVSRIRGYQKVILAGFEFRLAPGSSNFNYDFDGREKLTGAQFVQWTDLVQMQMFVKRLKMLDAPIVVDVGAYHGLYALLAGAFCSQAKQGRVLAFEPVAENYDILQKNIALNNLEEWVTPINKAVGESSENLRISRSGSQSQMVTDNSINSEIVDQVDLETGLPNTLQHIDILMIDVEGAELPVLRGFPWERIDVSYIFCEFHPYAWKDFGYTAEDMTEFLKLRGFQAFDMFQKDQTACRSECYLGPILFRSIKAK